MHRPRIALYSHDAMGIGHMRRNLLIADTLRRFPTRASVLLLSGAVELNAFPLPAGVDCLTLPALRKRDDGTYGTRSLRIPVRGLIALRARMIRAALETFQPDVLIVDKVPRGLLNELDPSLEYLHRRGKTRCVLGMRDVLDEAEAVRREWKHARNEAAIRDYYNAVWVYGDPAVYDASTEYRFPPDVTAKVRYTGYLDPRRRAMLQSGPEPVTHLGLPPGRLVVCQAGGGQDGGHLTDAFARAVLPPETNGVILTGPYMPRAIHQRLSEHAGRQPRLRVLDFINKTDWLVSRCDRVIAMGGYNTLCEILSFEKAALIVPRVKPRCEQLIRARRFRDLGLVDVLRPDQLSPGALSEWLAREPVPPHGVRERIDFKGLERLPRLLEEVLGQQSQQKLRWSAISLSSGW